MLFDSWAAALSRDAYFAFGWSYLKEIAQALKESHPDTPVILFPKGVGAYLDGIDGEFEVFGVDWGTPLSHAKKMLGGCYVLQGNLEPHRLYNKDSMKQGVEEILSVMGKRPGHIFNLGHGMLPDLPRENAIELVQMVKSMSRRS